MFDFHFWVNLSFKNTIQTGVCFRPIASVLGLARRKSLGTPVLEDLKILTQVVIYVTEQKEDNSGRER